MVDKMPGKLKNFTDRYGQRKFVQISCIQCTCRQGVLKKKKK